MEVWTLKHRRGKSSASAAAHGNLRYRFILFLRSKCQRNIHCGYTYTTDSAKVLMTVHCEKLPDYPYIYIYAMY